MPFKFNDFDCLPLVFDKEMDIHNEQKLAEYVASIVVGHFAHIKKIIRSQSSVAPKLINTDSVDAIKKLTSKGKTQTEIEKRDGWVFQIISWLALCSENKGKNFYCQQPHDAPAQHGIDGIALLLKRDLSIENIVITEDKCTENHRTLIPKIWDEFELFEKGHYNNKVVSRVSALLENLNKGAILEKNQNSIYKKQLWRYRVGINRSDSYQTQDGRKRLFKGYDLCVTGVKPHRRFASTLYQDDIRAWMEQFCLKVIAYLKRQGKKSV